MRFLGRLLLVISLALCSHSFAADNDAQPASASGLPLPRFASLRSDEVNMRTGPGFRYPIDWVFHRKGLPIEITAEYDVWRRVRDPSGSEGWIHKSELTGKRFGLVSDAPRLLHKDKDDTSPTMANLQPGALGQILGCSRDWCKMRFDDSKGYLHKSDFWGAYPAETFD